MDKGHKKGSEICINLVYKTFWKQT